MLARAVLCGATDAPSTETALGRPKYQITLTECEHCQRGYQRAGADQVEIAPAMLDAARCDASIRKAPPTNVHAHVGVLDEPVSPPTTNANPHPLAPAEPIRARNTTPPAVRRRVLERDQHRCQIPGCRNTLDLDVHHILPRADGGTHDPEYLHAICGGHHRAVHAGRLHLSGTAHALVVCHADGSPYGAPLASAAASRADVSEKVFGGLRWLGYKETQAKRALARALAEHSVDAELTEQALLKSALALLGERSPSSRGRGK
jgi:hypothetical protein